MAFDIRELELKGMYCIMSHVAVDNRGYYRKNFERNIFAENMINFEVTEWSDIYSHKGTIRGLHYQKEEPQAKLVHVIKGAIFDVAVDLREDSETFGKWHGELLRENDHKQLFIPGEFAHGFLALEEDTIFSYQCSGKYIPDTCGGIFYNDSYLNINWPLENIEKILLTEKDRNADTFLDYCKKSKLENQYVEG